MSVEISDGSHFFSWYNDPTGNLQLSYRPSPSVSEVSIFQTASDGTLTIPAYNNAADPSNPGYEMVMVDHNGTFQRIPGNFANIQSLLAASGIGNTGINLPQIQQNYTRLNSTVSSLITSTNLLSTLVGTTDVVSLSHTVSQLQDTVSRLSSTGTGTSTNLALYIAIGEGIVFGALIALLFVLYLKKR